MPDKLQFLRLDELVEQCTEKVVSAKDRDLPYIGLEHIAQGQPALLGMATSDTSVSANSVFRPGDILFGKLRPNLRKSFQAKFDGYCSTDILVFRALPGISPDFAARVFQWEAVFEAAVRTTEGTKMPRTSWDKLRAFQVFVPDFSEQRAIAAILDTVDAAIQQTEALIAKLKQMKAGLLHDLLTRGLDENGELRDPIAHPEQFKESALGLIPRDWEICPLGSVASVDRGKFAHRPRNEPRFYGGPYPFIQTGDVTSAEGGVLETYSQTLNEHGAAISREFPAQTIAVTIAANIADTAILGRPMFFPDSIVGAVVKAPNSVRYVELCIRRAKLRLDARAPQSAQKNINLADLRPLLLPLAKPEEQERIAAVCNCQDSRLSSEEAYRDKLKQLKKGLMDDLLTGRVRVNQIIEETQP